MSDTMSDFIVYASGAFLALFCVYCLGILAVLCVQEAVRVVIWAFKKRRIP